MNTANDFGSSFGSTSSSLLARVKSHDAEAWRRLVRIYGPWVASLIRRARLQTADAEDVFQTVFQAIARGIGSFRKDRPTDTFRGWLRTIVRSKLVDFHRRLGSQPQGVGGSAAHERLQEISDLSENDAEEVVQMDALRLRALETVRSEFEERTWQMFWRVAVDGHEVKEVAHALGVTPSAVRLAKSRILRRLRDEMAGLEP